MTIFVSPTALFNSPGGKSPGLVKESLRIKLGGYVCGLSRFSIIAVDNYTGLTQRNPVKTVSHL